jgi:hypothetical protein
MEKKTEAEPPGMLICEPIKIGEHIITHYNVQNPHDYVARLQQLDEHDLLCECEKIVWFSSFANNNPISDYHFMCYACYDECKARNRMDIYNRAHEKMAASDDSMCQDSQAKQQ